MLGIIMLIVLALGGGASFAAESSVPGDVLYGVKTNVNEEVRGLLAVGGEADAKWEARLAERRLEEAAKLQAKGKLSADVADELNSEFTAHAEAAIKMAHEVKAKRHAGDEVNATSSNKEDAEMNDDLESAIETELDDASKEHADLFRVATGDVDGDGKADRKAFVLPHVLEITSPRDSATGQASGKREAGSGHATGKIEADLDADGKMDVEDSDTSTGVDVQVGGGVELRESPSKSSSGAN